MGVSTRGKSILDIQHHSEFLVLGTAFSQPVLGPSTQKTHHLVIQARRYQSSAFEQHDPCRMVLYFQGWMGSPILAARPTRTKGATPASCCRKELCIIHNKVYVYIIREREREILYDFVRVPSLSHLDMSRSLNGRVLDLALYIYIYDTPPSKTPSTFSLDHI